MFSINQATGLAALLLLLLVLAVLVAAVLIVAPTYRRWRQKRDTHRIALRRLQEDSR